MALASQALKYNHVLIQSPNTGGKAFDLTAHLEHMEYFENIMSPTISMKMKIRSSFNFVSGLPIRGGEMIAIELETLGGTFKFGKVDGDGIKPGSGELYVYGMKNLDQPSQAQTFTLHIVPLEYFKNETSRCMFKFKSQTIDQHVKQILGPHVMNIDPDRIGIIEKTKNTYSFIGNTKKPFHTITWLCPKSITGSKQGVSGEGEKAKAVGTAGYFFYENQDGFNFRSIEGLVSKTRDFDDSSDSKQRGTDIHGPYVYQGHGAISSLYKLEENFKINFFHIDRGSDIRKALAVGQYANKTIFFDSLTHVCSQYDYKLEDEVQNILGEEYEVDGTKLPAPDGLRSLPTRLFVRVSDHGTVGIGSDGFETSGIDEAYAAKSFSRYNALFSQSLNIQVSLNTNLKVGDIINCVFPELSGGQSLNLDEAASGNYLIVRVNHHIQPNASFSSLNLIRDSYGYKKISTDYGEPAVEGGYTISKKNLKTTGQLVRADTAQYGNTFPAGSFNITN